MTNLTRKFSVIALAAGLAFGTAACDDDDNVGGGGSTLTTVPATVTTITTVPVTITTMTTTSTSSSSTSMTTVPTTVTSSTTSTTMGQAACDCNVTWSITSADTLGSLQYDTDYSAAGGSFEGSGAGVNCTALAGDFTAFNDVDANQTLSTATISTAGFTGPTDVSECNFETDNAALAPGDFTVTITDQSAPDFTPTNATMEISSVTCVCAPGSTLGSTTTTTIGATTTTTSTSTTTGGATTTTSTTSTSMGGANWNIEINLDDAVLLGALQYEVDYSAAGGEFVGAAGAVSCTSPLAPPAFVTFNDQDATTTLNFAAVDLVGFMGPATTANCIFASAAAPVAGDFVITVVDASDPGLMPVVPLPAVTIGAITAAP